ADATVPLYQSLDENQKRRFLMLARPMAHRFGDRREQREMRGPEQREWQEQRGPREWRGPREGREQRGEVQQPRDNRNWRGQIDGRELGELDEDDDGARPPLGPQRDQEFRL